MADSGCKTNDANNGSQAILCVVGELGNDAELLEGLKEFDATVKLLKTVTSLQTELDLSSSDVWYIIAEFDGEIFDTIRSKTPRIFGTPAIFYYAKKKLPLPPITRPLFCVSMIKVVTCFSGFKEKQQLTTLIHLVHHMGGSIRKDFSTSVTHVIANKTSGEKYHYAVSLGKPVVNPDWILNAWEHRSEVEFSILNLNLSDYKIQPFMSCNISFVGFSAEEQLHMESYTVSNGGKVCSLNDSEITHLIIEEQSDVEIPQSVSENPDVFIVTNEWFWASIRMDLRADEMIYQLKTNTANQSMSRNATPNKRLTPNSRARKRKRIKETLGNLASYSDVELGSPLSSGAGMKQRRSTELGISLSPSAIDVTMSPPFLNAQEREDEPNDCNNSITGRSGLFKQPDLKNITPCQQVCYELLQTETNYVGILHTIITVIKEPIEDADQVGGRLLEPTEVKIIFGNLQPIYDVHSKLKDDLTNLMNNWKEEHGVGNLILKYSQDFLKAYPPFVNFFEKTKEMLLKCDATKPRFHAFLKICQGKQECGRQSLTELLIRPVQRLPSVILLLNDILKHTNKGTADFSALEEAVKCLREVLTHINEDKRKTEGQVAMFTIVNDIENCPPNLLSSHRNLVTKADMMELSGGLSGKGDSLTMFLFTDVLEICKRRKFAQSSVHAPISVTSSSGGTGGTLALRSPSVVSLHSVRNSQKNYKHIELMPLSHIKRIVDIKETEECHNVFALVCRSNQELKERLYAFALRENESVPGGKLTFLRTVSRQVANAVCRPDAETFLASLEPHQLDIMTSDVNMNTLSKACRFASKTSKKVGRAFSFGKSQRQLTRAVSTLISPLKKSPADPTFTPPSGFRTPLATSSKRFPCASAMNLNELGSSTSSSTPSLGKRIKSFTLGPVKRL